MTAQRIWFVFDMQKREDTSKPRIGVGDVEAEMPRPQRRAQPVRNAPRGFGALGNGDDLEIQEMPLPPQGYGFVIMREDRKDMEHAFTEEQAAIAFAKQQAEKFPKTLFGVFSCTRVFETTTPTVIEKQFTDGGELIVSK